MISSKLDQPFNSSAMIFFDHFFLKLLIAVIISFESKEPVLYDNQIILVIYVKLLVLR
jgi:hypothetical protein